MYSFSYEVKKILQYYSFTSGESAGVGRGKGRRAGTPVPHPYNSVQQMQIADLPAIPFHRYHEELTTNRLT